jgi:hypothetical protein
VESRNRKVFQIQNPKLSLLALALPKALRKRKAQALPTRSVCLCLRQAIANAEVSKIQNSITHFHHLYIQHLGSLVDNEIDIPIVIGVGILLPSSLQQDRI